MTIILILLGIIAASIIILSICIGYEMKFSRGEKIVMYDGEYIKLHILEDFNSKGRDIPTDKEIRQWIKKLNKFKNAVNVIEHGNVKVYYTDDLLEEFKS